MGNIYKKFKWTSTIKFIFGVIIEQKENDPFNQEYQDVIG